MFSGKRTSYNPKANEHTMVVNIDKLCGSFTCVVWDGFEGQYYKGAHEAFVGRFARGNKRIEVLVYGGTLPRQTIVNLLSAFVGGKWVKMTLKELEGGAVIQKHEL
jgi:hypothetical protein